jgi:hypothetical protein
MIVTYENLPDGASVVAKYRIDGGAWEYSDAQTSGNRLVFGIDKRFLKIEYGVDLTATTETPEVTGIFLFVDALNEERPIGQEA